MSPIDYRDLFGWEHAGVCCSHAIEMMSPDPEPVWGGDLGHITIAGVDHITDRYAAIRADRVLTFDHPVKDMTDVECDSLHATPLDDNPGPDVPLHPEVAGRLIACGLTLRATDTVGNNGGPLVAVMSGDEHVGVYQSARRGVQYADLLHCVEVARKMRANAATVPRGLEVVTVADVLAAAGTIRAVEVTA